jgi:2-polyprenyl-6-methoxyphenol hydroxylase-like FAD-dependent oxidoreductase
MKNITHKTIAIVGGGPGGLTLARLLQMNGLRVKVYERDAGKTARLQGGTLDLHDDSGLKALHHAGLMEAFRANYRPGADKMLIVDRNAAVLMDNFGSGEIGPERPEIDRGPLREILLDSLTTDTVVWDCRLTALTPLNSAVKLEFANGTSAEADLVVGADGANSKIRPYVTSIQPIYSGVTIVQGAVQNAEIAVPDIQQRLGIGKIIALGNGTSLFISAKGDGSLDFYTGHKTEENWAETSGINFSERADVLKWFQAEFLGWSPLWDALIQNADLPFLPRPQYFMPPDQSWETLPNLTLLGDAAHVMPPYAGEGVNMAMLDALELAECLISSGFPDTQAALAAYETKMHTRVSAVIRMTLENTEEFHSPNAISHFVEMFTPRRKPPRNQEGEKSGKSE